MMDLKENDVKKINVRVLFAKMDPVILALVSVTMVISILKVIAKKHVP